MRSVFVSLFILAGTVPALAAPYDVAEKDIATLQADMTAGRVSAADLVRAYEARIASLDRAGPTLNSVIALNPEALTDAEALDAERKAKGARGPLHGIPILVKDNIETADPMPTTAGSLALAANVTHRDAPVVARLRAAGAIILGKTNLSEWANFRSSNSISGWSGLGGLVRNPYVLDRSACGSSSGSGAAVAASLAAAALGTETNGSLVCPGSLNGIVALKPTLGLLPRTHIVPISHSQDTPGPMTRSVADAALLLAAMAGSDPEDAATTDAEAHKSDYALSGASLRGKRLGVVMPEAGETAGETDMVFAAAVARLKAAGAEIVEISDFKRPTLSLLEHLVLDTEFKADLDTYLQDLPSDTAMHNLADLIAFNHADPRETVLFGQDEFESAEATAGLDDPAYLKARDELKASSRAALDGLFSRYRLDALIRATDEPAFRVDAVKGDNDNSNASGLPATSGYPHLTLPMGIVRGLPVGLSFIGPAWSDGRLLALGAAFEAVGPARQPPHFIPTLETGEAFAPVAAH